MTPSKNVMTDITQQQGAPELEEPKPEQQPQEPTEQLDQAIVEKIKEALQDFNVRDINPGPEGTINVILSPYEPNFVENAYQMEFTLAEQKGRKFKAIALTEGKYKDTKGGYVHIDKKMLMEMAGLFRNKPLVLVDFEKASPSSTHEGNIVGVVTNSFYCPTHEGILYEGLLDTDLDLSEVAGSSIKVAIGDVPIAKHIALIPKCGKKQGKCFLPQDANARILTIENASPAINVELAGGKTMIDREVAKALAEVEAMNKNIAIEKKPLVRQIVLAEVSNKKCVDPEARIDELYSKEFSTLIVLAQDATKGKTEGAQTKAPAPKKELNLAEKAKDGELLDDLISKRLRGGA
jgi:hypothetical protein